MLYKKINATGSFIKWLKPISEKGSSTTEFSKLNFVDKDIYLVSAIINIIKSLDSIELTQELLDVYYTHFINTSVINIRNATPLEKATMLAYIYWPCFKDEQSRVMRVAHFIKHVSKKMYSKRYVNVGASAGIIDRIHDVRYEPKHVAIPIAPYINLKGLGNILGIFGDRKKLYNNRRVVATYLNRSKTEQSLNKTSPFEYTRRLSNKFADSQVQMDVFLKDITTEYCFMKDIKRHIESNANVLFNSLQ